MSQNLNVAVTEGLARGAYAGGAKMTNANAPSPATMGISPTLWERMRRGEEDEL